MRFRFWMSVFYTGLMAMEVIFMVQAAVIGRPVPAGDFVVLLLLSFATGASWISYRNLRLEERRLEELRRDGREWADAVLPAAETWPEYEEDPEPDRRWWHLTR